MGESGRDTEFMAGALFDARERERMLTFARRWLPYGGGPAEDIMVDFGIAPSAYFARLKDLLDDPDLSVELDPATKGALREVCRRRLWLDE